jgi:hypothetical protein
LKISDFGLCTPVDQRADAFRQEYYSRYDSLNANDDISPLFLRSSLSSKASELPNHNNTNSNNTNSNSNTDSNKESNITDAIFHHNCANITGGLCEECEERKRFSKVFV